ncbi:DinI-like family protein, partial [Escherichia coli]|nr:DinI-like family protein [Escherichia coli]
MRVEICIAKEKISKMPKGSVPALQQEMLRRISKRYDDVDVIVRAASNDGLTILRAVDKESALE